MGKDVSPLQRNRPVVAPDSLAQALQPLKRDAAVDISIGLGAIDGQGSVETVQRILEPIESEEGYPAKVVNLGLFAIKAKDQIEMFDRLGMTARLVAKKTNHSPCVHVVWPLAEIGRAS